MNQTNNTQQSLCRIAYKSDVTKTCLVAAYVVLFLAACLENSFVIYLVRTCKELKQYTFYYLIINMAVADVLDVVFATVLSVSFLSIGPQWIPGLVGKISCNLFILSLLFPSDSQSPHWL